MAARVGIGEHTSPACGSLRPRDDELFIRKFATAGRLRQHPRPARSPAMSTRQVRHGESVLVADRMPARPTAKMAVLISRGGGLIRASNSSTVGLKMHQAGPRMNPSHCNP